MRTLLFVTFSLFFFSLSLSSPLDDDMPSPFYRVLQLESPMMTGNDVFILQNLIVRSPAVKPTITADGVFGSGTAKAVGQYQEANGLDDTQIFESTTANLLLDQYSCDNYTDDGTPAISIGAQFKYKFLFQVFRDRSHEMKAFLFDKYNNLLYQFVARLHGHSYNTSAGWPDYTEDEGVNQFTSDGNTPTGLWEADLNSPEDDPTLYGPYPINRLTNGRKGNAAFMSEYNSSSPLRSGFLLHTGEWDGWYPAHYMPNSAGCIHAHPDAIRDIWQILVNQCGVVVRDNPFGTQPYPYQTQGLISVEQVNCA